MLVCLFALLASTTAPAAPRDDAVKAYREYVAAIRSGSAEKVAKLVEPVPDSSKQMVAAYVEMYIAIEAVKSEIAKRFKPPELERGDLIVGQLPAGWLKDVVGEPVNERTVELKLKGDPEDPEIESDVGFMVRRGDTWVVAAMTALGLEHVAAYAEPPAEERESRVKIAKAWLAATKTVRAGLEKKQFKTAAEADAALLREFGRAVAEMEPGRGAA